LAISQVKRASGASSPHRLGRKLRCPSHYLVCIDIDPKAIPPKRTYRSARYFSRGEFARLCPEALRKAGGPITTGEIVASIIAAKGLPENLAANLLEKTLTYLRGKLAAGTAKNSA
jgi:hypothetical protein